MRLPRFAIAGPGIALLIAVCQAVASDEAIQKFIPANNAYARRIVTGQFTLIDDLTKIDPDVLAVFHTKVQREYIANRGERFNSTDVVTENLPARRFILAGTGSSPGLWFIWYEHGGIAYHHNLVVLAKNRRWEIVAAAQGIAKGSNDFESLRQAVKNGQFFSLAGRPDF